jgi:hypothetical protein
MKMPTVLSAALALVLAGCATQAPPPKAAEGTTFTGQVWTWDEADSTITLRRGTEDIRVKVTPDQLRGLQLHQTVTVRGQLAPPKEIERIVTPAKPLQAVPRGPVEQHALDGTVTAADPRGRLSIQTDRGPLHVWAAAGADQRFQPGAKVRVDIVVQPVDMVPAAAGTSPATMQPAASPAPTDRPGDYAVITGRVMGVERTGTLIVESPTGPVQVWVPDSGKFGVEQPVQVRTFVSLPQ